VIANGSIEAGQKLKLPELANTLYIYNDDALNTAVEIIVSYGD